MLDQVTVRCSELPLLMKCASSRMPVANPLTREDDEPARLGSGLHAALAWHVETKDIPPDFEAFMKPWGLENSDEFEKLFRYGVKAWAALREFFEESVSVEKALECNYGTFILTGHADVTGEDAEHRYVLDWKSGYRDYDASWQLHGYGVLAGATKGIVTWLRDQTFEVIDLMGSDEFREKVGDQVAKIGLEQTAGQHCDGLFCPRSHECEAYADYAQHAVSALMKMEKNSLSIPEQVARLYPLWKTYEQASARYKQLLNDMLDRHGELVLEDGRRVIRASRNLKVFYAASAIQVMVDYGIEAPAKCFKVAGRGLEDAIKATAKGAGVTKGARWMAFLRDCETAGALRYSASKTRREVRGGTGS